MAKINENYDRLPASYLFSEIAKRTKAYQESHPGVRVMRLGIGNTTEPLTPTVINGLKLGVEKLADVKTYTGYGEEQGNKRLRQAIAEDYKGRGVDIDASEVFVSDGAKCDTANIQSIFGLENIVAVQDPAYPVYVDTNILSGRNVLYMPCPEENNFFPFVPNQKIDLIYLCSPNNPTGAVATKKQLSGFVDFAIRNKAVIIYDAAYSSFIRDENLPRSIYEVDGAKECTIEVNSFSKSAGFTGVRLGWTVVPFDLSVEGVEPRKINAMWNRRQTTFFNGASNIVQEGGLAALTPEGQEECQKIIDYYMGNADIIREGLTTKGLVVYGGVNAPYLWMKIPNNLKSWDFFDKMLEEAHVVGTPGSGFGPGGEGYFRLSAFGHRENVIEAIGSIKENLTI
ncbi:LL-diaminopimelate aminotransferase [Candidatus Pacearchaeota archaeon]|nr:LL-diaminopimelate aminotransferase [Candidatus Pacearchaeota archaeon]